MKEKSNFIPNLHHPIFLLCQGFCKGLVVGSHVWVFVIWKTCWRFAENLVCFFCQLQFGLLKFYLFEEQGATSVFLCLC
jgi:hypothetical protein